jgi:hypothetical protein
MITNRKRLILAIVVWSLLPLRNALGWNLGDHRELAKRAVEDVAKDWGLDQPCDVHPLSAFLEKLKPLREELGDPWQFSRYLKINPKVDIGTQESLRFAEGSPKGAKALTPQEILFLYATDADDGRDQDLFVRDETGAPRAMFPDEKWFGAFQGPNSQAFRHIEKPPFRLRHPITTFGIPLRSVGEASLRAEIYFQLSRLAFSLKEDYWGWRFLAGGLHYLQDLHQPYHAGQITPVLFKQGLGILLSWGGKEKGFMGSFAHVVSNSHRFFETYLDQSGGRNDVLKEDALEAARGSDVAPLPGSIQDLARSVRDASNLLYAPLSEAIAMMTGDSLAGRTEFYSDGDKTRINSDPKDFIREGPAFEDANKKVFGIVKDRFASAGRVTRAYVQALLEAKKNPVKPEEILSGLDDLLGETE